MYSMETEGEPEKCDNIMNPGSFHRQCKKKKKICAPFHIKPLNDNNGIICDLGWVFFKLLEFFFKGTEHNILAHQLEHIITYFFM